MSSNFLLWCLTTLFILFPLSKSASMLSIVKRLNRGKEIPNIIEKDSHCVAEKLGRFWNGGKTMVFWDRGRLELCCIHFQPVSISEYNQVSKFTIANQNSVFKSLSSFWYSSEKEEISAVGDKLRNCSWVAKLQHIEESWELKTCGYLYGSHIDEFRLYECIVSTWNTLPRSLRASARALSSSFLTLFSWRTCIQVKVGYEWIIWSYKY